MALHSFMPARSLLLELILSSTSPVYLKSLISYFRKEYFMRHCATCPKVAVSIPDDVTEIFHWHNPSGRILALGSTQPLTEMSTRNISWGVKTAGVWGWQTYHLLVPIVMKSGSLSLLEPSRPVQACNGIALPFTLAALGLGKLALVQGTFLWMVTAYIFVVKLESFRK